MKVGKIQNKYGLGLRRILCSKNDVGILNKMSLVKPKTTRFNYKPFGNQIIS